jgi:hypothetical protein
MQPGDQIAFNTAGSPRLAALGIPPISCRMKSDGNDRYGSEEAARRRREVRRDINMPPQPRSSAVPKPKERPASKGRVHKGKMRN